MHVNPLFSTSVFFYPSCVYQWFFLGSFACRYDWGRLSHHQALFLDRWVNMIGLDSNLHCCWHVLSMHHTTNKAYTHAHASYTYICKLRSSISRQIAPKFSVHALITAKFVTWRKDRICVNVYKTPLKSYITTFHIITINWHNVRYWTIECCSLICFQHTCILVIIFVHQKPKWSH